MTTAAKEAVTHEEALIIGDNNVPSYARVAKVTTTLAVEGVEGGEGVEEVTAVKAKYAYVTVNDKGHILDSKGKALKNGENPLTVEAYEKMNQAAKDEISGFVELDESTLKTVEDEAAVEEERNDYSNYTRFLMHLTTMTETELASIKTYAEFYTTWDNSGDSDWSTGILYADIDFGGLALHFGYDTSLFAPFTGYTGHYNSLPVGYVETWQARATVDLGNSAAIAFGVESAEYAGGATGGLDYTGALTFDLEPLTLGTMAIAHAYDENNYGYGVTGYVTLKPTDRLSVGVGGTYGVNTLDYLTYTYDDGISNGDLSGWNVFGGVEYKLTDKITTAVDAGYTALDVEGEAYDIMGVNGNVTYEPVSGLVFMAEGGYLTDSRDNDSLNVVGRVQYSF